MVLMSHGNDESRARKAKADADAFALLSALNSRGRLAPIPAGTILQGKYRVERYVRGSELKNQYVVTWDDQAGMRLCWECGFDGNKPTDLTCRDCDSDLGGRTFILSERWRIDFQTYHDVQELGFFHPGLTRLYELFEDSQRLFSVSEFVENQSLADMGSPFPIEEVLEIGLRGCDVLEFLHAQGISLVALGKEQIVLNQGAVQLHELDIAGVHPGGTPEAQRQVHLERFARILQEFVPPDRANIRAILEEVCEHRIVTTEELRKRLEGSTSRPRGTSLACAAMSDVGMCRTLNEDTWGWEQLNDDTSLYVVADGMGGHDSGEVASELAVKTILAGVRRRVKELTAPDEETLENVLDESFQEANNTVKGFSEKRRSDMGTTLVSLLLHKGRTAFIANVGDSRAYLVRDGQLLQLSQDHSLVANLVAMGKISKAAARNHPHSNILVRTVGKEWDVEIDIFRQELRPGDAFLLCSDGLWGEVEDSEVLELMRNFPDPRIACQELIRTANAHGGHDNVTAVLVRVP